MRTSSVLLSFLVMSILLIPVSYLAAQEKECCQKTLQMMESCCKETAMKAIQSCCGEGKPCCQEAAQKAMQACCAEKMKSLPACCQETAQKACQTMGACPQEMTGSAAAMEEAFAKMCKTGEHHRHLRALVGKWEMVVKMWMDPSQPPQVTKGTATRRMVKGGRFLEERVKGDMMGKPFLGMGITGYDNLRQQYVSIWFDNCSTSITTSMGVCDQAGTVFTFHGEVICPMTNKPMAIRMVTRIVNKDQNVFEWYETRPDGKEYLTMEIVSDRRQEK